MHSNPCTGVWYLVKNPVDYEYSSAKFYISGEQGKYLIKGLVGGINVRWFVGTRTKAGDFCKTFLKQIQIDM